MTWLILIVRMGRAALSKRRHVCADLEVAGAVRVSEDVWAIPDTPAHHAAVDSSSVRAAAAGGDILILPTTPENTAIHEVFEAALVERLMSDATALERRYDEFTLTGSPASRPGTLTSYREQDFIKIKRDAQRLSDMDVVGIEAVTSIVARVQRTGKHQGLNNVRAS